MSCVGADDARRPGRDAARIPPEGEVRTDTIRRCYGAPRANWGIPVAIGVVTRRYTRGPMRVDQVIPSLASRDAIGVHTLNLRNGLRAAGMESDVYYGSFTPDVEHEGRPVTELGRAGRERWLLYQASIGSPVYDILATRPEPKLVNYHNITPAALLRDWEPNVAYEAALGRTQLARLAGQSRFAVADSAFNESELHALGYEGTAVVPLLIDMAAKSDEPDPALAALLCERKARDGGADLLYVGKISPHKAPHDLVKMLDVLRRLYDPAARLHLVGSPLGETYEPVLRAFVAELGLGDAVNLAGSVTGARARGLLPGRRRVRDRVRPRGVLRAAGRGHGPRGADRGLRRDGRTRNGGRRGPGAPGQVPRRLRRRRGAGDLGPGIALGAGPRRVGESGGVRPGRFDPPVRGAGGGRGQRELIRSTMRSAAVFRSSSSRRRRATARLAAQPSGPSRDSSAAATPAARA